MTILRTIIVTFIVTGLPIWAAAHGSGQHVLGTVTAIDTTHMEVKTPKGESVSVQLTDKTKYTSKILRRPKGPPQVGDRVAAEVEASAGGLVATEVHFSNAAPKGKP